MLVVSPDGWALLDGGKFEARWTLLIRSVNTHPASLDFFGIEFFILSHQSDQSVSQPEDLGDSR